MQLLEINKLYSLYAEKSINRSDFEGLVYQYLVKNQDKTDLSHWKDEEYEDFLSWFYLRLHKAIDTYKETGSSFEIFFSTVMRVASKEFRTRLITKNVTEYSAWSIHVPELYAREETPFYSYEDYSCENSNPYESHKNPLSEIITISKGRKNPKQLLALILKCYYYISDDFLDRVASNTGIERKKLRKMVEELRIKRSKREDEIYRMKESLYSQYYRCIVYEKRLRYIPEESNAYLKLKIKRDKARKRLERMRERISKIRTDATNREVAEVIGISKGSVDSTLYTLKTKWNNSILN